MVAAARCSSSTEGGSRRTAYRLEHSGQGTRKAGWSNLPGGINSLSGVIDLQLCREAICEAPLSIAFKLSLRLARFVVNERDEALL